VTRHRLVLAVLLLAAASVPAPAAGEGAWRTFLRPLLFSDLIAEADTVWCGSGDGGLLRHSPSSGGFVTITREPGGLASNRIGALALDRSRRLWVGTLGGGASVLQADRSTWTLVNAFDGLPSDSVVALEAQGDTMWIGTTRGFALWNGREVEGRLPDGINPSPFGSDYVTGIAVLGDSLWLGTLSGAYVGRISTRFREGWTLVTAGLTSARVDAIASDGAALFALAGFAVHRLDAATGQWTSFTGLGPVRGLSDDRGRVFAAGGAGAFRWDGSGWTNLNPALNSSGFGRFAITCDEHGRVYAAGTPAVSPDQSTTGLYRQPDGGGAWSFSFPPGPPGNDCLNLEVEGTRLYVTTVDRGVGRFDGATWRNWFVRPTPVRGAAADSTFRRPAFPYAMLADRSGRKWFGCWAPANYVGLTCVADTGAIEVMDDSDPSAPVFARRAAGDVPQARITFARASTLDSLGSIWFGMDSPCVEDPALVPIGLERYRSTGPPELAYTGNYTRASTNQALPSDQVWSLVTDRIGRIWAGTSRGLSKIEPPAQETSPPVIRLVSGTEQFVVRGLAAYRDSLWMLTSSEVRRYSASAEAFRASYGVPAQPSFQAVRPMDVSLDGTVWIGTVNGVRAYRQDGSFSDYTTENSPIADNDVRTIRVDRRTGHVWMATANGISRFDPGYVPPVPALPALAVRVYPNPVRLTGIGLSLRLSGSGTSYTGGIYDLGGREVHRFAVAANGRVVWDGRDRGGELVRPGVYFLRAESAGRSAVVRVAVVR
jgi:hypothetical protein